MDQVYEFFRNLLGSADWPPRWYCGNWTDFHGWLYIVSDLMIWAAYSAIPFIIVKYISRRKDIHFNKIYVLFAAFILACGATHFLDALMFWIPAYRLNALVRFITGVLSLFTVIALVKILPTAFSMQSNKQLQREVLKRQAVEDELRRINARLNEAQEIAKLGSYEWDIASDRILWSPGMYKILDLQVYKDQLCYDDFLQTVHPEEREHVKVILQEAISKKEFSEFYYRVLLAAGHIKTIHARGEFILNEKSEVLKLVGTVQDVTIQKLTEQEILSKSIEVEAVNKDLQRFADIASHDLQEPLRKITFYTSLLDKEFKIKLGINGRLYIDKLINSSKRMQILIQDILNFSRLSANETKFTKVNLDVIVQQVLIDMEVVIKSSCANIKIDAMPDIEVNTSQFGQLFQNLISNAIKFRKKNSVPEIDIRAEFVSAGSLPPLVFESLEKNARNLKYNQTIPHDKQFCIIYVTDNGIGFDELYLDQLFVIFQRLHGRSAYEGTGIGLAICKRIVDNHHGNISARSVNGNGSTFIVTVPISQNVYG